MAAHTPYLEGKPRLGDVCAALHKWIAKIGWGYAAPEPDAKEVVQLAYTLTKRVSGARGQLALAERTPNE